MRKFFTLIELLIVIVILGILAAITIPNISEQQKDSITASMNANIRNIQTAVDTYALKHNGEYPTYTKPTLENPSYIDFNKLYPKYLKSKPDYSKIKNQKYWVDVFGKVWGSTVDSPHNVFQSDSYLEWKHENKIEKYNLYEVKNNELQSSLEKTKITLKYSWSTKTDIKKVRLSFSPDKTYLLSSVDEYGLESAPVGISYSGYQDWFQPLLQKEGKFVFEMSSEELMYWDAFRTVEDKPEGTSIQYRFSVTDENGTFKEWTDDFKSLTPSKNIKVEIEMKGYNGKLPSLYDLRIFYHYQKEEIISNVQRTTTQNINANGNAIDVEQPAVVIDQFTLPSNKKIEEIILTDSYSPYVKPEISYSYKVPNQEFFTPVSSLVDIPEGSIVQVKREYEKAYDLFVQTPIVKVAEDILFTTITKQDIQNASGTTEQEITEWTTVDTLHFFAHSGDGSKTRWLRAEIDDIQPEFTRIQYTYQSGNNGFWSWPFEKITDAPDSESLKVTAKLQVKTEKLNQVQEPTVNSIRIIHEKGVADLSLVKPTGVIIPKIDNNKNTNVISTASKVTWTYEASDPRGKQIIDAVWGGDKQEQYPVSGKYTVTLQLTNSSNYKSDLITYTFEVKEEKPVAVINLPSQYFLKGQSINWDASKSYDPDGDGIKQVEWAGQKQNSYSTTGDYTVSLRVQDNEGNWSDWVQTTIHIVDVSGFSLDYPANATIYVDANRGNDTTGDGSYEKPFASIQKAIDNVKVDKTQILIAPGTYYETLRPVSGTYQNREHALLRSTPNLDYALIGDPNNLPTVYVKGTASGWWSNPIIQLAGSTVNKPHSYEMRNLHIIPTQDSSNLMFFSDLIVRYPTQVNVYNVYIEDPYGKMGCLFYLNGGAYGTNNQVTVNVMNSFLRYSSSDKYKNGTNNVYIYNTFINDQFYSYKYIN